MTLASRFPVKSWCLGVSPFPICLYMDLTGTLCGRLPQAPLQAALGPTAVAVAHCGSGSPRPHRGGGGPLRLGRPRFHGGGGGPLRFWCPSPGPRRRPQAPRKALPEAMPGAALPTAIPLPHAVTDVAALHLALWFAALAVVPWRWRSFEAVGTADPDELRRLAWAAAIAVCTCCRPADRTVTRTAAA